MKSNKWLTNLLMLVLFVLIIFSAVMRVNKVSAEQSEKISIGNRIVPVSNSLRVFDEPGGRVVGIMYAGGKGIVAEGPMLFSNSPFWRIKWYEGLDGWVAEVGIATLCGDMNLDGKKDGKDVSLLTGYIFSNIEIPAGIVVDLNDDGVLDKKDEIILAEYVYGNGLPPNGCDFENRPPVVDYLVGSSTLAVGEEGYWRTKANDPEGELFQYRFDFGDGSKIEQWWGRNNNPPITTKHTYVKEGTYKIKLDVFDNFDSYGKPEIFLVNVKFIDAGLPPVINYITGPENVFVGAKNKWSALAVDPEGGDLLYTFNWTTDSQFYVLPETVVREKSEIPVEVYQAYMEPNGYKINLKVEDSGFNRNEISKNVEVVSPESDSRESQENFLHSIKLELDEIQRQILEIIKMMENFPEPLVSD